MHFKAAIFDMDGTLIDSLGLWDLFWGTFSSRYQLGDDFRPSLAVDKAVRTLTLMSAMELIHQEYHIGANAQELYDITRAIMVDFYQNQVQLKPGVEEFLMRLKAEGTKMCIASATAKDLIALAMQHCRLEQYFDTLFSCSDIGKNKDQPDVFLLAQKHLGEAVCDTWVFEDSLTAIETAHAAGLPTVAIYDRNNYGQDQMQKTADHYIAEGETLLKLLDD